MIHMINLTRVQATSYNHADGIASVAPQLAHMLPSNEQFAAAMDVLGIRNDTTVVLFDHLGVFSAPRVWWTFKVFGHDK